MKLPKMKTDELCLGHEAVECFLCDFFECDRKCNTCPYESTEKFNEFAEKINGDENG